MTSSVPSDLLEQLCQRFQLPNPDAEYFQRLSDLINEAGMLRHTPRTGYAFLGSGAENVAEHSFRTCIIGYILARLAGADSGKTVLLCLFHDLHEARTGDINYLQHRYVTSNARAALDDATRDTGLEKDILGFWDELEDRQSHEALLAHDADQLDLVFNLKAEFDKGNSFAAEWLESAVQRLGSEQARTLAGVALRTDHNRWWYERVDKQWWISRDEK